MDGTLSAEEYEALALAELRAASAATARDARAAHLNQASVYATLAEKVRARPLVAPGADD
ncbi:MAG TPA: hypothetical protein VF636_07115 [Sphingomonas sp.]